MSTCAANHSHEHLPTSVINDRRRLSYSKNLGMMVVQQGICFSARQFLCKNCGTLQAGLVIITRKLTRAFICMRGASEDRHFSHRFAYEGIWARRRTLLLAGFGAVLRLTMNLYPYHDRFPRLHDTNPLLTENLIGVVSRTSEATGSPDFGRNLNCGGMKLRT